VSVVGPVDRRRVIRDQLRVLEESYRLTAKVIRVVREISNMCWNSARQGDPSRVMLRFVVCMERNRLRLYNTYGPQIVDSVYEQVLAMFPRDVQAMYNQVKQYALARGLI
jgi:hypothetical protein